MTSRLLGVWRPLRAVLGVAALGTLAACATGPKAEVALPAGGAAYTERLAGEAAEDQVVTASAPVAGGSAQHFLASAPVAPDWWRVFGSAALDHLVAQALHDSPTVAAAEANLRQAGELYQAERGSVLFPAVNAQASAARERTSGAPLGLHSSGNQFSLYNAAVNVSYSFDLYGSGLLALEGLRAQVDYQRFQLAAARLALAGNLVTAAVREASLRAQIQALEEVRRLQQQQVATIERRLALGAVARIDLVAQRTALAQTEAGLPPLQRQLEQNRHLLAVLAGRGAAELGELHFELDGLQLPAELPLTVGSELARGRPDLLAADALLRQASAQVGVATGNLYPQLQISGNYGFTSLAASQLFQPGSVVWGLSAGLAQPLFHGGALRAQVRAAQAAFDAAAANYRQAVLLAFENVADALRALQSDARQLAAQADAQAQADEQLQLAGRQYAAGALSYLALLNAQAQVQQARLALAQARAARLADSAALYQALGGGALHAAAP